MKLLDLRRLEDLLIHGSARRAVALSCCGTALIAAIDHATGIELRIYPLYFVPLCLGAWHAPPAVTLGLVSLASTAWGLSNWLAGLRYEHWILWPANLGMQALSFGLVAALISRVRTLLLRERELSRVDPLTQLANRRAFHERATVELRRAARTRKPFTLACIDLDNLKVLNDWAGHAQGDSAIMTLADALRDALRSTDLVARLGGDEFVVLLPDTDACEARAALERVHALFGSAAARFAAELSVSIGGVTFVSLPSLDAALSMADSVLYRVKRGGKNAVEVVTNAASEPMQ